MKGTVRQTPVKRRVDANGKTRVSGGGWWWQITLTNTVDGVPTRQQVRRRRGPDGRSFTKRSEAQAALTEFLAAHGKGDTRRAMTQPSAQLLSSYLDDWLAARRPNLRPATAHSYATICVNWIVPHLGQVALKDLTGDRIAAWTAHLRLAGKRDGSALGSRSVSYSNTVLTMALSDAVESRKLAVSPMSEVPKRQRPTHKTTQAAGKVWDAEQARTFLASAKDDRLFPLFAVLLATGCRRGEALGLRWTDLDLDEPSVRFSRNRVLIGGQVLEGPLKNDKPRMVDLDPVTVAILRRWSARQAAERLAAGPDWADGDGYVFTDPLGAVVRPAAVSNRFDRVVSKLDVPKIPLHGLRHTSGTLSLDAGVALHVVAARLGHDPAILLRIYAHKLAASGKDAAGKIGSQLYGEASG